MAKQKNATRFPQGVFSLEQIEEQRTALAAFFGREDEIAQVRDFLLSDKLFLVVHGTGGSA